MPAALLLAIQGISAVLSEAPQIEALASKAKDFFAELFKGGVITADQQDAIHAHVDAILVARRNGTLPPEFTVEADPES